MTAAAPGVSVVICAYTQRRWEDMIAAVDSALAQPDTLDVVLVIDHEDHLLAGARERFPDVTVVPNEYRRGLSGARNTGLSRANGEIVAFLDDDAAADSRWLGLLLSGFEDSDVVAVGGSAHPLWPSGVAPALLPPELLWVVGCTYRGQPTRRADVRNVIGCSMAFRRRALEGIGGFNLDTGRVGQIPLGAEETEVCIRLRQADARARVVFEPLSRVSHRVTPDRTTWRYLRRRCFFEGVSKAALSLSLGSGDALSSERSYTARVLPLGILRELRHGRVAGVLAIMLAVAAAATGYAYGSLRQASINSPAPVPVSR